MRDSQTTDLHIRRATINDVPAITRIYNHAIENTTATFDIEPKTLEDRREWFKSHSDKFPLIVADVDGNLAGWAAIRPYGTRAAYQYTVESAVYIDCDYQGQGIGLALMERLLTLATEQDYHAVLALVVGGNEASVKLHRRLGFEQTGVMREVGWKFGQWLDVLIFERILSSEAPED